MLEDDRGREKQVPGITKSDLVGVVKRVMQGMKEQEESKEATDQTAQKVDSIFRQVCDSEGNCRLITREEFARYKAEEKVEREKREKLPKMNAHRRDSMSPSELDDRDRKFARLIEQAGGTTVDAHRFVVNDRESRPGLKLSVLKMLQPDEIEDFVTKCVLGPDGKLICSGLGHKGFRIQKKDGKNWETLGATEEEKKKVEAHF